MTSPRHKAIKIITENGGTVRTGETIADCVKYRNKIGLDVFLEALDAYRKRPGVSMHKRTGVNQNLT